MEKIFKSNSDRKTLEIGCDLGKTLKKGDVVAIYGDLGAGKTVISKGIAKGLGIKDEITSPTYTFVHEYRDPIEFYHFDMYRIIDPEEAVEIGFPDYLSNTSISIIEWPDKIEELLPKKRVNIKIEKDLSIDPDYRKIYFHMGDI